MKRTITLLTVLLAVAIFAMPTQAKQPDPVEREPFQMDFTITPTDLCSDSDPFTTDRGKLLVIEHVSTLIRCGTARDLLAPLLITTAGGTKATHWIPFLNAIYSDASGTDYQGSQKVKIYADPSTIIRTCFNLIQFDNPTTGGCSGYTTISGYYLPE